MTNDVGEWKIKQLRESLPFEVPDHLLAKVLKEHEDVGDAVDYFLENGIPEEETEKVATPAEPVTSTSTTVEDVPMGEEAGNITTGGEATKEGNAPVTSTETKSPPPPTPPQTLDKRAMRAQKAAERTAKREAKAREEAEENDTSTKAKGGKKDRARDKKEKQKARKREKKQEAKGSIGAVVDQGSTAETDYKVVMV